MSRRSKTASASPDLVVEVISPDSRGLDTQTKFDDYEAAGIGEYWLIDLDESRMTFFRLESGCYAEAPDTPEHYESAVVPGPRLELAPIRAAFTAL